MGGRDGERRLRVGKARRTSTPVHSQGAASCALPIKKSFKTNEVLNRGEQHLISP